MKIGSDFKLEISYADLYITRDSLYINFFDYLKIALDLTFDITLSFSRLQIY